MTFKQFINESSEWHKRTQSPQSRSGTIIGTLDKSYREVILKDLKTKSKEKIDDLMKKFEANNIEELADSIIDIEVEVQYYWTPAYRGRFNRDVGFRDRDEDSEINFEKVEYVDKSLGIDIIDGDSIQDHANNIEIEIGERESESDNEDYIEI
jgi:hypothetical protein